MKAYLFFLVVVLASCSSMPAKQDETASKLKREKYAVDSLISAGKLDAFFKVKGQTELVPLEKGRGLKNIEITYNIFKDTKGRLLYIAEMPFSENDDWFIAYKSYFDIDGKLFAFQRQNNFFGSECAKGAAVENMIKYIKPDFTVVDSSYTLTDTFKKTLDPSRCKFPYNFPYKISRSVNEYLQDRNITSF